MSRKYKITASIIGPYLPNDFVQIGKFTITKVVEKPQNLVPAKVKVTAQDESLVVISQDVEFDSMFIVEWEIDAYSSKVAYESGSLELEELISCLELPASGNKYYSEIVSIELLNAEEAGHDPEGMPSHQVHVLSYESQDLSSVNTIFYEALLSSDPEVKDLLKKFYAGIKSEVLSSGDADLKYYKLMEEVSHKTLKKFKTDIKRSEKEYNKVIENLKESINTDSQNLAEKVQLVKNFANQLKALDYEQIGERILLAARMFSLRPEILETIKIINKYRAKILAHGGSSQNSVQLEDARDIREISRILLMHYINRFYNISPPDLRPVKENDSWYRFNYSRSDAEK